MSGGEPFQGRHLSHMSDFAPYTPSYVAQVYPSPRGRNGNVPEPGITILVQNVYSLSHVAEGGDGELVLSQRAKQDRWDELLPDPVTVELSLPEARRLLHYLIEATQTSAVDLLANLSPEGGE